MGGETYWNNYYQSIQLGFQLTAADENEVEVNIRLPQGFGLWCKGNTNNGKILFISMVRELLFEKVICVETDSEKLKILRKRIQEKRSR